MSLATFNPIFKIPHANSFYKQNEMEIVDDFSMQVLNVSD